MSTEISGVYTSQDSDYMASSDGGASLSRIMLSLGDFEFSIDTATYDRLQRSAEWRWNEQPLIGKGDLLQYTGKTARTISLDGVTHASFRNGTGAVDDLYDLGDRAEPMLLVSSAGDVFGYWVITKFQDDITSFLPGGLPRKRAYTLELKFYGDKLQG